MAVADVCLCGLPEEEVALRKAQGAVTATFAAESDQDGSSCPHAWSPVRAVGRALVVGNYGDEDGPATVASPPGPGWGAPAGQAKSLRHGLIRPL